MDLATRTSQIEPFQNTLKQWTHFPEEIKECLKKAKTAGTFLIGKRVVQVVPEDNVHTFILYIFDTLKLEAESLTSTQLRKFIRISYLLNDLSLQKNVKDHCLNHFLQNHAYFIQVLVQEFCKSCLASFTEESFKNFISKNIDEQKKYPFAMALALEALCLLYYVLPYLMLTPLEKKEVVKLALTTPLTLGLDLKAQVSLLCSMRVEEFFLRYRIQAPNQDNIRSLAGYLARQMKGIKEFQPLDSQRFTYPILNFLHYANGVFKYGIVCKARAVRLGISQVSSLDKNPRNQNEVEVNCVKKK